MHEFDLAAQTGLTDAEAAARLERDGFNELPAAQPRSLFAIAAEVVREPMFLLLWSRRAASTSARRPAARR